MIKIKMLGRKGFEDAIHLSESMMKHMLCLDEKTLENEGEGTIRKIIAGVFRLYLRLSDSIPLMIDISSVLWKAFC